MSNYPCSIVEPVENFKPGSFMARIKKDGISLIVGKMTDGSTQTHTNKFMIFEIPGKQSSEVRVQRKKGNPLWVSLRAGRVQAQKANGERFVWLYLIFQTASGWRRP